MPPMCPLQRNKICTFHTAPGATNVLFGGPRAENREDKKKKKKKTTDMQTPTYRVLRNSEAKLGTLEPVYD